jgi:hypothetical protein
VIETFFADAERGEHASFAARRIPIPPCRICFGMGYDFEHQVRASCLVSLRQKQLSERTARQQVMRGQAGLPDGRNISGRPSLSKRRD